MFLSGLATHHPWRWFFISSDTFLVRQVKEQILFITKLRPDEITYYLSKALIIYAYYGKQQPAIFFLLSRCLLFPKIVDLLLVIHQNDKHEIDYFLTSQALNDYISWKEEVSTLMLGFSSHTSLVSVFQVGAGLYSIYLLRGHPLRRACLQEAEENSQHSE